MPATISRISASSSTTRISAAMVVLPWSLGSDRRERDGDDWLFGWHLTRESQAHERAAHPVGHTACIEKRDRSAVLLHDLSDDREAEAGPLLPRRDIGLEQALP